MKIHGGWGAAGLSAAAVLAAAMMTSVPALAQDPAPRKPAASKKVPAKAAAKAPAKKAAAPKKKAADVVDEQTEAAEQPEAEEASEAKAEATAEETEASEEAAAEATEAEAADPEASGASEEDWAAAEGAEAEEEPEAAPPRRSRPHRSPPERGARPPVAPSPEAPAYIGPYTMDYIEGAEVPPGYIKVERVRKGLVIAGAVTFGVSWLVSATAGVALTDESNGGDCAYESYSENGYYYSECHDNDENEGAIPLFIPLVGPFIAMGTMEDVEGPGRAALFLDGVVQVGGMAMLIAGVAAKQTVLVRSGNTTVSVAPGPGSVNFTGSF
jgi:hypothetical protein